MLGLYVPSGIYPTALITMVFIPVIPIVIGVSLGTLISMATASFERQNTARIIILLLFTVYNGSQFSMQNVTAETWNS